MQLGLSSVCPLGSELLSTAEYLLDSTVLMDHLTMGLQAREPERLQGQIQAQPPPALLGNSVGWFRRWVFVSHMTHCSRSHLNPAIDVGDSQTELSHLANDHISCFRVQNTSSEKKSRFQHFPTFARSAAMNGSQISKNYLDSIRLLFTTLTS